jgi:integrase
MDELLKNMNPQMLEMFKAFLAMIPQMVAEQNLANQKSPRLDDALDEVIADAERKLRPNSVLSIKNTSKKMLDFFSPAREIGTITPRDVENMREDWRKTAPRGFAVPERTARGIFNRWKKWGYIKVSPFEKVERIKLQKEEMVVISEEDLKRICSYFRDKGKEHIADMIELNFYTGLRAGELLNLKKENIDWKKGTIQVGDNSFTTKGKKIRYIPIMEEMEQVLRQLTINNE